MPSVSKKQNTFMKMVLAYKRGELKNASEKIKKAAKSMKLRQVKDYVETNTSGLPKRVSRKKVGNKK